MASGAIDLRNLTARKRGVVVASVLFAGAVGVLLAVVPERGPADMAMTLLTGIGAGLLVLFWCHYDSRQRGSPLGSGFRWTVVLLGPLALFVYLARTRGVWAGWRSIGAAALLVAGLVLLEAFVFAIVAGLAE